MPPKILSPLNIPSAPLSGAALPPSEHNNRWHDLFTSTEDAQPVTCSPRPQSITTPTHESPQFLDTTDFNASSPHSLTESPRALGIYSPVNPVDTSATLTLDRISVAVPSASSERRLSPSRKETSPGPAISPSRRGSTMSAGSGRRLPSPYSRKSPARGDSDSPKETTIVRKKRKRADPNQLRILNDVYSKTAFPSTEQRLELATVLNMSARSVQIW